MEHDVVIKNYSQISYDKIGFPIWTIYSANTRDYTGLYVARLFDMEHPTHYVMLSDNLNELRKKLPNWIHCMGRDPSDPQEIIESWF